MSQLPGDVLLLIFDLLVPRDKLECMTVCRKWHDIIQHHSLFRVIYLNKKEKLNQFTDKVKRDPALGAKVERMILKFWFDKECDATVFGELFPNLRDFNFSTLPDYSENAKPIELYQDHPWCEKIEKMVEKSSGRGVQALLVSGLCRNLTYITVAGLESKSVSNFFSALANAPALKTLRIHNYTMTFEDLELLHENTPLLHSLKMSCIKFTTLSTLQNIKPATSVKVFHCDRLTFPSDDVFNMHLPYIAQKYTCVEDLRLELQSLVLGDGNIDEEIELIANQRAIISSYMRTLAPQLKNLSLWIFEFERSDMSGGFDFNILDECGCQIEKLVLETSVKTDVLEWISKAAQMQHIQSLTVESIDCGGDENDVGINGSGTASFDWLARFTNLKELKLSMYGVGISMGECTLNLLNLFMNLKEAQLESLSIRDIRLKVTDSKTPFVYPSLKKLKLRNVSFEVGIDVWISHTFPNLKHLELDGSFNRGGAVILPKIDLSYLRIVREGSAGTLPILLMTLGNKQQRIYNASQSSYCFLSNYEDQCEDVYAFPSVYSLPISTSKDVPRLYVICNSVYNVDIINIDG